MGRVLVSFLSVFHVIKGEVCISFVLYLGLKEAISTYAYLKQSLVRLKTKVSTLDLLILDEVEQNIVTFRGRAVNPSSMPKACRGPGDILREPSSPIVLSFTCKASFYVFRVLFFMKTTHLPIVQQSELPYIACLQKPKAMRMLGVLSVAQQRCYQMRILRLLFARSCLQVN